MLRNTQCCAVWQRSITQDIKAFEGTDRLHEHIMVRQLCNIAPSQHNTEGNEILLYQGWIMPVQILQAHRNILQDGCPHLRVQLHCFVVQQVLQCAVFSVEEDLKAQQRCILGCAHGDFLEDGIKHLRVQLHCLAVLQRGPSMWKKT